MPGETDRKHLARVLSNPTGETRQSRDSRPVGRTGLIGREPGLYSFGILKP
jgi:hypothetical protein